MTNGNPNADWEVVSFLTMRKLIGTLGVLLPIVLAVGCIVFGDCQGLLTSISAYYGTVMRNVFVGTLFTLAWFFFSYKGYDRRDDVAGDIACVCALGVALFPGTATGIIVTMHLISASALFLTLSYFSYFLFTLDDGNPTPEKNRRNNVYRACGIIMMSCLVAIPIFLIFLKNTGVAALDPVFWLETFTLWAFGVSWAVKGETLWKDATAASP